MKNVIFFSALTAFCVSLITLIVAPHLTGQFSKTLKIEHINSTPAKSATFTLDDSGNSFPLDFTQTSRRVIEGVVHIKSTRVMPLAENGREFHYQQLPDPFQDFFNDNFFHQFQPNFQNKTPHRSGKRSVQVGTGSGVVINSEGYIVTNNHVIVDADEIEVTLHDNRTFKAKVVGTDPSTDLALLQIKANGLPTIPLVNSDNVNIGQWVLAVGNPFNLNSTVTAGIVSAKARNINILQERYAVESFIQTDAAINPGNSGGALVNLDGGLVGINTAIASPTGAYSGYGFAVPSNIVNKVVEDLLQFGVVQRGVLGVMIRSVDGNLAKEKDLGLNSGVYVDSLLENSAAASAGIQAGDVITGIEDTEVKTSPELQALIAQHRPGDKVNVQVNRNGKEKTIAVTLRNRNGNTSKVSKEVPDALAVLGADFETLDNSTAKKLDIPGGVKVKNIYAGKLRRLTQMQEGFIITKVDGKAVLTVEGLTRQMKGKKGGVMLEGVYEDIPGVYYYAFGIDS